MERSRGSCNISNKSKRQITADVQQVKQWRVSYYSQLWGRSLSCVTCVVGEARCAAAYYLHFFFHLGSKRNELPAFPGKGFQSFPSGVSIFTFPSWMRISSSSADFRGNEPPWNLKMMCGAQKVVSYLRIFMSWNLPLPSHWVRCGCLLLFAYIRLRFADWAGFFGIIIIKSFFFFQLFSIYSDILSRMDPAPVKTGWRFPEAGESKDAALTVGSLQSLLAVRSLQWAFLSLSTRSAVGIYSS